MKKKMNPWITLSIMIILVAIILISGRAVFHKEIPIPSKSASLVPTPPPAGGSSEPSPTPTTIPTTKPEVPSSKTLDVPYTTSAPLSDWQNHQESCEESALEMYHEFLEGNYKFNGKTIITAQRANDEINRMISWQVKNYGREPDLSIEDWGKFAQSFYGYQYQIFSNITEDDIRQQVSAGHPVVVPVMTDVLNNPHYGHKPAYHILVIKGYRSDGVIVNDTAFIYGESYFYSWTTIINAIDAQTPTMHQGRVMAILTK